MTRRTIAWALAIAAIVAGAPRVGAYLKLGTQIGDRVVTLQWNQFPIRYFVSNAGVPGVTPEQFRQAVSAAFATWDGAPHTAMSSEFVGFTNDTPFDADDISVLGFMNQPSLDRVLGATSFTVDTTTGEIVDADIFFNSAFAWSVAPGGEDDHYDLQSIALHEIGHLHGLAHSALGETELRAGGRRVLATGAVMFPIAFSPGTIVGRTLQADDLAGIADLYGTPAFRRTSGSISGRVTKNGAPVVGAHVVAFNPKTHALVGGFSLGDDGAFTIAAIEPGAYILRAEPLDDADLDSFFDSSMHVDVEFAPVIYDRIIVVPRGGGARDIEVKVVPK